MTMLHVSPQLPFCHYFSDMSLESSLAEVQSRLFDVGAAVATPLSDANANPNPNSLFPATHTAQLERWIDALDAQLPPLKNFVIPVRV